MNRTTISVTEDTRNALLEVIRTLPTSQRVKTFDDAIQYLLEQRAV